MDQPSSRGPQLTPPSLPSQVRQGSSLHVKVHRDFDQGVGGPQAGRQTPAQQLVAGLDPAKIQAVAASQVVMSERSYTTPSASFAGPSLRRELAVLATWVICSTTCRFTSMSNTVSSVLAP
jgi:hypothetical protein